MWAEFEPRSDYRVRQSKTDLILSGNDVRFVRTNVWVGPRKAGGYECELDVVAIDPHKERILHYEPTMGALSWEKREERFERQPDDGSHPHGQLRVSSGCARCSDDERNERRR